MKELLECIYSSFDREWTKKHVCALTEIEQKQTYKAYETAADYVYKLLLDNGFNADKICFPADGKTVYQDKRMPMAWDAEIGKLTVISSPVPFDDPVVADFGKEPFSLIKHSVSTPVEGIITRLVTESQVRAGEDCKDAMVLLDPDTAPRHYSLVPALDLGALGIISEYVVGSLETPDAVQWVNACTEGSHWHVQSEDRPFIGFSVSPRIGRKLRQAVNTGEVKILVQSDGHRYEGSLYGVTSLIPGRQEKELWVMAHLYEPLIDDNSSGVIGAIGAIIQIKNLIKKGILPPLEFSIRLVFAMEMYGFAAFAEHFGGCLRSRTIGAVNMDGMPVGVMNRDFIINLAPAAVPFFGNSIMEILAEDYSNMFDRPKIAEFRTSYYDDMFLSDSTTGLPTIWPIHAPGGYWHNSMQKENYLDMEAFARAETLYAGLIAQIAALTADKLPDVVSKAASLSIQRLNKNINERMKYYIKLEVERMEDFRKAADIPEIDIAVENIRSFKTPDESIASGNKTNEASSWYDYSATITPVRTHIGLPYDKIKMPLSNRYPLPDSVIYGNFANILSNMDGMKNLQQIIKETQWEVHEVFSESTIKSYINGIIRLAKGGYLSLKVDEPIDGPAIIDALHRLGVKKGDLLLVHSSNSQMGYIKGGADTIIEGIIGAVGPLGTILMPTFTNPFLSFEGKLNKDISYRPYTAKERVSIYTGLVPKTLLDRPGVYRSKNATHSWAGIGPLAQACTNEHGLLDAPACENSPMGKALKNNGKVLFFGCDLNSNTFLHFLEHASDSIFLKNAVVKLQDEAGRFHTEVIKKHLPGHRDFYRSPAISTKFYRRALESGLIIKMGKLGNGRLYLIDLRQLYEIGMKLFKEDPAVTLCDDPNCFFCASYKLILEDM